MKRIKTPIQQYTHKAIGTYGSFNTPGGRVNFLLTKAKLGNYDDSPSSRLSKVLMPVREALNIKELDFNQLLQRDLDDHRIANELVPYILNSESAVPPFYPPIVAVLLPFNGEHPSNEFPNRVLTVEKDLEYDAIFRMETHENYFRFQCMVDDDAGENEDPSGQAILRWNDEYAKLVIIDGQHRAMALLAINRTINSSWKKSPGGEKYEPFYKHKILDLTKQLNLNLSAYSSIEFPVTICWFPDKVGKDNNPHLAARKLFVDINKNAKKPSESRLILLNDSELDNIFSRELLNSIRSEKTDNLPLYCVEYDNPEQTYTPRRWSVITNIEILRAIVRKTVFGPEESINDLRKLIISTSKKSTETKMGQFMRGQLALKEIFPSKIEDGHRTIDLSEIHRKNFPFYNLEEKEKLIKAFMERWGTGILTLLSEIFPYSCHIKALKEMEQGWFTGGDQNSSLAKEALFEGVGMFWTLEDGNRLWKEQCSRSAKAKPVQPETSKAWDILEKSKREEFYKRRASLYLGKMELDFINKCNTTFSMLNTFAAQVGLVTCWAGIRYKNPDVDGSKILKFMVKAINNALLTGPNKSGERDNRKLIFLRDGEKAFNRLPKLELASAGYFRYFWLELITVSSNEPAAQECELNWKDLCDDKSKARKHYVKVVYDHIYNTFKDLERNLDDKTLKDKAIVKTAEDMAKVYNYWFGEKAEPLKLEFTSHLEQASFSGVEEAEDDMREDNVTV